MREERLDRERLPYRPPSIDFHPIISVTPIDFLKSLARFSLNRPGTNDFYHLQRAKFTGGIFLL